MPKTEHSPDGQDFSVVWGPQRFYLSIGWKTLIAFALVVFIPMLGLMSITESTLRDAMEHETLRSLEANLRGAWRVYYEHINGVESALQQSAADPGLVDAMAQGRRDPLFTVLRRQTHLLPYASMWLAVDAQNKLLASANNEGRRTVDLNGLLEKAMHARQALVSTELIGNELFLADNPMRYAGLDTRVMVQVAVVPVLQGERAVGTLVGVILMNGDNWLPNAIHDYLSIEATLFGSVSQESRVIAASERPNNIWATGLLAPAALAKAIQSGRSFDGKLVVNDIPSYVISEPIRNTEGVSIGALSIAVKSSNIEALIARNARNIYLFIGLGIVLSLFVAFLAYRDTMTPLRVLIRAMDEFAQGRLSVRTHMRTRDEFEDVGRGFNRMASSIQEQQERVESFNSLTNLLISSFKSDELLQHVMDKVVELTSSQAGIIYLAGGGDGEGAMRPQVGYAVDIAQVPEVRPGQGLPGEALEKKRFIHVQRIPADCQVSINFGIAETLPREVAIFPIVYRDEVLGALLLATLNRFQPNELALLEYVTNQIAIVLENTMAHEQLERLSVTDELTGLNNRRYLTSRMEETFSEAQRYRSGLAVLIMDVDHFKQVNDRFGHQVGDRVLQEVSRVLADCMRESDLLGRYGGEEFLAMLPRADLASARSTAEKLRLAVNALQFGEMDGARVSISVGVAVLARHDAYSLDGLISAADKALYRAKEQGRNRVELAD